MSLTLLVCMFDAVSSSLIILFFWLFGLAMFSFCFLLAAFFDRARVGSTTAALIFLAIFFPYFAVEPNDVSQASKSASLHHSLVVLSWALRSDGLHTGHETMRLNSLLCLMQPSRVYPHQ